jgi:hypothetical protein
MISFGEMYQFSGTVVYNEGVFKVEKLCFNTIQVLYWVIWKVDSTRSIIKCHVAVWNTQSATQNVMWLYGTPTVSNTICHVAVWNNHSQQHSKTRQFLSEHECTASQISISFSRTQRRSSFVLFTEQPNITVEWRLYVLQSVVVLFCNFLYSLTRVYILAFRRSKAAYKSFWKARRHGTILIHQMCRFSLNLTLQKSYVLEFVCFIHLHRFHVTSYFEDWRREPLITQYRVYYIPGHDYISVFIHFIVSGSSLLTFYQTRFMWKLRSSGLLRSEYW